MIESTQQERKGRFRMPVSPAMMLDLEMTGPAERTGCYEDVKIFSDQNGQR